MSDDPDPYLERRRQLVDELRGQPVSTPRVLEAMGAVPRHLFVPEELKPHAYANRALPIGSEQTISQPLVVATMTDALKLEGGEKVLEVGTGSGYQAAVLSLLAGQVYSLERCERLHGEVRDRLSSLGYGNVTCSLGDGTRGLPSEAPFDAIIVTAGSPAIPEPLKEQLVEGGRLVIPVGERRQQALICYTKLAGGSEKTETVLQVVFVPLIGEFGWPGG